MQNGHIGFQPFVSGWDWVSRCKPFHSDSQSTALGLHLRPACSLFPAGRRKAALLYVSHTRTAYCTITGQLGSPKDGRLVALMVRLVAQLPREVLRKVAPGL